MIRLFYSKMVLRGNSGRLLIVFGLSPDNVFPAPDFLPQALNVKP